MYETNDPKHPDYYETYAGVWDNRDKFKERKLYIVIENTPGYLPEDDDPPIFDQYQEALNYLGQRWKELYMDDYEWDLSPIHNGQFFIEDPQKTHDLGRVVSIEMIDPSDELIMRSFDAYR